MIDYWLLGDAPLRPCQIHEGDLALRYALWEREDSRFICGCAHDKRKHISINVSATAVMAMSRREWEESPFVSKFAHYKKAHPFLWVDFRLIYSAYRSPVCWLCGGGSGQPRWQPAAALRL
eukprot:673567-Pelagomonas_calceolata.AAC.1